MSVCRHVSWTRKVGEQKNARQTEKKTAGLYKTFTALSQNAMSDCTKMVKSGKNTVIKNCNEIRLQWIALKKNMLFWSKQSFECDTWSVTWSNRQ